MALASLEASWPVGATLYQNAVVAIEIDRLRRLVDKAAMLQAPDRINRLQLIHQSGKPSTVASTLVS